MKIDREEFDRILNNKNREAKVLYLSECFPGKPEYAQIEVTGADGCVMAFSGEEAEKACLVKEDSGRWRVIIPSEKYHRRWCKDVQSLEAVEDVF